MYSLRIKIRSKTPGYLWSQLARAQTALPLPGWAVLGVLLNLTMAWLSCLSGDSAGLPHRVVLNMRYQQANATVSSTEKVFNGWLLATIPLGHLPWLYFPVSGCWREETVCLKRITTINQAAPICTSWFSIVFGAITGKNSGVDCHFLLQGTFPSQGFLHLLHWQADSLPLSYIGNPLFSNKRNLNS